MKNQKKRGSLTDTQWDNLEKTGQTTDDAAYNRTILGVRPALEKPAPEHHVIVLQIPSLAKLRQKLKRAIKHHYKLIRALAVVAVLMVGSVLILKLILGRNQTANETGDLTPSKVYVPKQVPDGFTASGNSQSLENGARLYTFYDNKGREITITQQAKPADLDMSFFESGESFETSLGDGYIIQEPSRITGYIIADDTLILFNSTDAVASSSLRELMQAFQP